MENDTLLIILGNQLFDKKYISQANSKNIFMAEDFGLCTEEKYHKQKLFFYLSAMRSFKDEMEDHGYRVFYNQLELKNKNKDFIELLEDFLYKKKFKKIKFFEIEDKFFEKKIHNFLEKKEIDFEVIQSPMFLCSREKFKNFAKDKKNLRMVGFYQSMRKDLNILINDGKPVGGKWSFDEENRKKIPKDLELPKVNLFKNNIHGEAVAKDIKIYFDDHPGILKSWLPDNRKDAKKNLKNFLHDRFKFFGTYEDAMQEQENFLFHSMLSPLLNVGLLSPLEVVNTTIKFAKENDIPLNSLEGFIRQIIGWREFIRGVYQEKSDIELGSNYWNHSNKLNCNWYDGTTGLTPLDDVISMVNQYGYTHHIPRLMILSNILTLCEIDPREIYRWFMEMFVDSSEWVMVPNVFGMGTFADGGIMSTKPYTCGSNYVLKMSNYKKGPWCEILDGLYWRFTEKHRNFYESNPRLSILTRSLDKMDPERKERIFGLAEDFIKKNSL